MRVLFSLLCFLVSATAFAAQPLLTPAELAAKISDRSINSRLVVVDIRDGKVDGKTPYQVGHIAGAQHAPYSKWRGPKASPGQLPSSEALTALVRSLGIDAATPVVVVYEGKNSTDFGSAARVYWTLKAAGVREIAVLNGGIAAWGAAGLPLTTESTTRAPSTFEVKLDPNLIATRADVEQVVDSQSARLIDARPREFFEGETRHTAAKAPGTIVGAQNISHDVWFTKTGTLLPRDEVQRVAQLLGVQTDQPTISFCNTGHWAATNWFVLSELLGHDNVKLYPESIVEWSNAGGAMDNVPSRLRQFWLQLKRASDAA
jgi:thiosulfate/3-mercaptopyruvate sulfurtransferase